MSTRIAPPIRWVGGKGRLLDTILPLLGNLRGKRYYEPCLGGGSVFFALRSLPEDQQPSMFMLSDVNIRLIMMYRGLRDDVDQVVRSLAWLNGRGHTDALFVELRSALNDKAGLSCADMATHMIALNKLCYNGLYRENKKGEFNVPRGDAQTISFDEQNLRAVSKALRGVVSANQFSVDQAAQVPFDRTPGDHENEVWFIDPPYIGQYAGYNATKAGLEFHRTLVAQCKALAQMGARVILCAANNEATREVYGEPTVLADIQRTVGTTKGKGKRGKCKEAFYVYGS